ncbi:MAG: hypothetical protein ABIC18_02680 [Candidatus Omnitrophota bacterium]
MPNKKLMIIISIVIFIGLALSFNSILAQKNYEYEDEDEAMVECEDLTLIEEDLARVLSLLEKGGNKEILKKLDQVLKNQAEIKDELKIIKIRASR